MKELHSEIEIAASAELPLADAMRVKDPGKGGKTKC
jgi:hypothetical protein